MNAKQISEIMGLKYDTIKAHGKRHGILFQKMGEKHHSTKHSDETVDECISLYERGVKISKISKKYGIPYTTIYDWCMAKTRTGIFLKS
jgi:transposase